MVLPGFIIPRTATSTNTYTSINKVSNIQSDTVTVQVKENNVNAVTYKILVSLDDITYQQLPDASTTFTVAKNGSDYQIIDGAWKYVDVQIVSSVADAHGNLTCTISGSTGM